jgi:hypothetical protein
MSNDVKAPSPTGTLVVAIDPSLEDQGVWFEPGDDAAPARHRSPRASRVRVLPQGQSEFLLGPSGRAYAGDHVAIYLSRDASGVTSARAGWRWFTDEIALEPDGKGGLRMPDRTGHDVSGTLKLSAADWRGARPLVAEFAIQCTAKSVFGDRRKTLRGGFVLR